MGRSGPRCRDCGGREWDDDGRCRECRAFPTLGYAVLDLMEATCVIPDREEAGEPFITTDEQGVILLHHYRINPRVVRDVRGIWRMPFWYPRGSQVTKPQKWGKAPLSAGVVCVEAHPEGPVLFDGWDADGQPVGRPWPKPHIQVTACSEDQTDNVWRALQPMIELGPLADVFPDTGLTRINLPTGGLIEPVTASAISRLGQRICLSVQDQTESWVQSNNGHKLRDAQRRGLAGTGGRFFETPNAWDPVENSVAQRTFEDEVGVFKTYEPPPAGSVRNKTERRKVLRKVYGDSTLERGGWIDLDRIDVEIEALLKHDPAQAERWFMNRCQASEGAAFDFERFRELADPHTVERGEAIVLGVDGARYEDSLAVVATHIKSGYQWPVIVVERPENAPDDYEHDFHAVDAAVKDLEPRYHVWRIYIDPQRIDWLVESWSNHFGEKRVQKRETFVPRRMAFAIRAYQQAIAASDGVTHDGSPVFLEHVRNARKQMTTVLDEHERPMFLLAKDHVRSPRKIDAAMAAILSWEARSHALQKGAEWMGPDSQPEVEPKIQQWQPGRALDTRVLVPSQPVGPLGSMS